MIQERNDESPWSTEDWLREFAEIFFLRFRVIFLSALLVLLGAGIVAFHWPRTYQAEAHILVRARTPGVSTRLLQSAQERYPLEEAHVTSEMEILRSPRLVRKTVVDLENEENAGEGFQNDQELANAVRESRSRLEATVVPSSHVIRVRYYSRNPNRAERFVDQHLGNYLTTRSQIFSTPEETEFLTDQAERYRKNLRKVREQIVQKTADAGKIALIDKELTNNSELQSELRRRLKDLQANLARQKEEIKPLKEALNTDEVQFFAFLDNRAINRLADRLAALLEEREKIVQEYQPESRRRKAINKMVEEVYGKLRTEARNIYKTHRKAIDGTVAEIGSIKDSLEELGDKNVKLNKQAVEIRRLQNRAEMLESSYKVYSEKKEEAEINSAVAEAKISGDVNVLNEAAEPAEVAYPKTMPTLMIGLAAAIIVGLTLGFVTEYLDQSIHRASEVHRFLELPVVCSIEKIK